MDFIRRIAGRQPRIQNESECLVSAVLVPIVKKEGIPHVLFEVRSESLNRQPGEVCFPGGKVEPGEMARPQTTAIREAVEELGIRADKVVLVGPLDYQITPPGTLIYPYLGIIEDWGNINPNPCEVASTFLAPLGHFTSPPRASTVEVATRYPADFPFHRVPLSYKERGDWSKQWSFPVYFYEYGEHFIWGVTARILNNFITLCHPELLASKK
ncbi:MAG: CoA pyrophosphatase [Desulfotomaculaceae bacterium]|nr:CoA pyrophosphatase [Desulfotomaculaceae bacterium]